MTTGESGGIADRTRRKIIFIIVFGVLMLAVSFVMGTLRDAGEMKELDYHSSLDCTVVEGVLSSEDITVDRNSGMAFVSSGIRGLGLGGDSAPQGAIAGYDLESDDAEPVILTSGFDEEFFPHGIGLYTAPDGAVSLFVINHRTGRDYVEIFDYDGGRLVHRKSVSHDLMHNPNDLIPTGPDSFYVTNDHGNRSFNGQLIEDFLKLAGAYVLHYDGEDFRVVAENLSYANGINLSPDGRTLYVAEVIGQRVSVFDRDPETNDLALKSTIPCGTGVDNIDVAEDGALWIGAHAKLLTFAKHAKDRSLNAPSQVLRIAVDDGGYSVEEVYLEDGSTLSGSSVAATYKDKILIGGVFAPRFLVCERK